MVVLTDTVDWTAMEVRAEKIHEKKLKNAAGRPPRLRATLGALTLLALRRLPYREVEEQIRYYAPARYLCGLTETDWTPDFTTIRDFAQLMGEDGVKLINEGVVGQAVKLGLAAAGANIATAPWNWALVWNVVRKLRSVPSRVPRNRTRRAWTIRETRSCSSWSARSFLVFGIGGALALAL